MPDPRPISWLLVAILAAPAAASGGCAVEDPAPIDGELLERFDTAVVRSAISGAQIVSRLLDPSMQEELARMETTPATGVGRVYLAELTVPIVIDLEPEVTLPRANAALYRTWRQQQRLPDLEH